MNKRVPRKLIYSRMNKRGFFLAEETIKIIIAVICIGLLVFILGKVYYNYSVSKEDKQAKDTLDYIEQEINAIKEGEKREIMVYNPSPSFDNLRKEIDYWVLASFGDGEKPLSCGKDNCVCMCKNNWKIAPLLLRKTLVDKCNEKKICFTLSEKISSSIVPIKNVPLTLSISKSKNVISLS